MIILSILCPTIPSRQREFQNLRYQVALQIAKLMHLHPTLGHVEFLYDDSKPFLEGGLSIGKKREALVIRAEGRYLCFLDDDEAVSPNYVESLVRLCHLNADVVAFRNISKLDTYWMIVDMSIHYPNDQASPKFMIRRKCWHICPVRTEFAKQFSFDDTNYSEDWSWFSKVLTLCTTEVKTEEVLHEYRHSSKTSEADKIVNHVLSK